MTSIFSDLAAQIEATADVDVADAQSDITKFAEFVMMDQSGRPHQLQWFHKDMLKAMTEHKRVVIEAFRGSGKSRSAITFVLWLLMKNRDLRIMIVTESDSLAKEWLQEIEHYMETENYIRLAGDMIPTRTSGLTWTNERKIVSGRSPAATGYSLLATGIQGQIRGRRCDVIICDDLVCVGPGTRILTVRGWQPIESIQAGEQVLSQDGKWHKVEATGSRVPERPMVKLITNTIPERLSPILTDDHPVLATRRSATRTGMQRKKLVPTWIPVGELKPGDWLAYPIAKQNKQIRHRWPKADMKIGLHSTLSPISSDITNNPEFWWMVGLYLADGSAYEQGNVTFFLGGKEIHLEDRLRSFADSIGRSISVQHKPEMRRVTFSSKQISNFLIRQFRPNGSKHLPGWIVNLPHESQEALLRGYADGDGHDSGRTQMISCMNSETLLSLRAVGNRLNYRSSIQYLKQKRRSLNGYNIAETDIYKLTFAGDWYGEGQQQGPQRIRDGYLWIRVKEIRRAPDVARVYDLKVKDAKSFVTTNACLHNSETNSHTAYQREVLSNWFHAALLRTLDIRPEEPLSGQVIYLSTPLYDNDLTAELRKQWA